jgi:tRNA pseudouridine38-40 synthase
MSKTSYILIVSYVGTGYSGWQVQPGQNTIQGAIEELLQRIFGTRICLRYASRTDSGVHALAQVAGFSCESNYSSDQIQKMLNTQLPNDIVIKDAKIVSDDFDPRKSLKKTYFYLINNSKIRDPFTLDRVWWLRYELNKNKILQALELFKGKKDFKAFMASGSDAKSTIREIYDIVFQDFGDDIKISFTGSGFLKQMIRNIVGTVVDIGRGRFEVEDVLRILESKNRIYAGVTAPAHGLYLEKVYYE